MLQEISLGSVKILSIDNNALFDSLKTVSSEIKSRFPYVKRILLFGSFAREDYTPESDVDILIIVKYEHAPFIQRKDVFFSYFEKIPLDINLLVYTEEELSKMMASGNFFIVNVMKEAQEL